jgi:wobble nucleotide-excising tRNase
VKNYRRSISLINQARDYSKDDFDLKCGECKETKHCSEFNKQMANKGSKGYRSYCRSCDSARNELWGKTNPHKVNRIRATKRARKLRQTPSWVDKEAVDSFYLEAQLKSKETGIAHHVDHMVPLKGETVSGLHVQGNLQVLTSEENISKGNRYWPDDWSDYV